MVSQCGYCCLNCESYNTNKEKCFTCRKIQKVCLSDICKIYNNMDEDKLRRKLEIMQLYYEELKDEDFNDVLINQQYEINMLQHRVNCKAIHSPTNRMPNCMNLTNRKHWRKKWWQRNINNSKKSRSKALVPYNYFKHGGSPMSDTSELGNITDQEDWNCSLFNNNDSDDQIRDLFASSPSISENGDYNNDKSLCSF